MKKLLKAPKGGSYSDGLLVGITAINYIMHTNSADPGVRTSRAVRFRGGASVLVLTLGE